MTAIPDGWYVDKSIGTIPLGRLEKGRSILETELPFGRRTNIEWCYLLGDFGVRMAGETREIVPRTEKLGFDSVTAQGLPHYGGNIAYQIPVQTQGGSLRVTVPHYDGAAVRVALDGEAKGIIAYPPYSLALGKPPAGEHLLTLPGNRENAFGPLHRADTADPWIGPDAWRTEGTRWTDSYRLMPLGIRTAPWIEETRA